MKMHFMIKMESGIMNWRLNYIQRKKWAGL